MLYIIDHIEDPLIVFVLDDPVRPEIPVAWRIEDNKQIIMLVDENYKPQAVVCVAYCDFVPSNVDELMIDSNDPTHAIFYTIWSYSAGAGRALIQQSRKHIQEQNKNISRFVTLSPPTEMARNFHLKNGASVFRDNQVTVNYEYK
jgi:hypothetical protein